ncbi:unnamed protein product [marine sediment metagenome]|uniref:Uncharacterized protein n=1 Tax=marine sediment metagenome TaxID=412755 RepID=X0XYF7_9ZZZZ
MTKHKRVHNAVDKFLAEKRVSTGGYAPCSDDDFAEMIELFERLISAKFGLDPDGDLPVQLVLVNRLTHEPLHYQPVLYDLWIAKEHQDRRGPGNRASTLAVEDPEAYEEARETALLANLEGAAHRMENDLRGRRLRRLLENANKKKK